MLTDIVKGYFYRKFKTSFAKSGEDIQIAHLLNNVQRGFYVDVGAHHPISGSNTYFFYLRGWSGICIEPNPEMEKLHRRYRSKDIFLNFGVAEAAGTMTYYRFNHSNLNTFSEDIINTSGIKHDVIGKTEVSMRSLAELLGKYCESQRSIDFMSIDVEGFELSVIRSNDWSLYRPKYVMMETHKSLKEDMSSNLVMLMEANNYTFCGKTILRDAVGTLLFQDNQL